MLTNGVLPGGPMQMARSTRRARAGQGNDAGGTFGAHLLGNEEVAQAPVTQSASPLTEPGTIAAMSPPDQSDAVRDREARSHGQALLGALGDLQLSLLNDGGSEALEALSRLAKAASDAADSRLNQVVRAIGQRVAVELAKANGRAS